MLVCRPWGQGSSLCPLCVPASACCSCLVCSSVQLCVSVCIPPSPEPGKRLGTSSYTSQCWKPKDCVEGLRVPGGPFAPSHTCQTLSLTQGSGGGRWTERGLSFPCSSPQQPCQSPGARPWAEQAAWFGCAGTCPSAHRSEAPVHTWANCGPTWLPVGRGCGPTSLPGAGGGRLSMSVHSFIHGSFLTHIPIHHPQ